MFTFGSHINNNMINIIIKYADFTRYLKQRNIIDELPRSIKIHIDHLICGQKMHDAFCKFMSMTCVKMNVYNIYYRCPGFK